MAIQQSVVRARVWMFATKINSLHVKDFKPRHVVVKTFIFTHTHTQRERQTETETDRQTERDRERQRQTETDRETERERSPTCTFNLTDA